MDELLQQVRMYEYIEYTYTQGKAPTEDAEISYLPYMIGESGGIKHNKEVLEEKENKERDQYELQSTDSNINKENENMKEGIALYLSNI